MTVVTTATATTTTMAEVRPSAAGGSGLFATRGYAAGDVIVSESDPLLDLSSWPAGPEQDRDVRSDFAGLLGPAASEEEGASFREAIAVPGDVPSRDRGRFRGMVHAGAWFVAALSGGPAITMSPEQEAKLLRLYSPSLADPAPDEGGIVRLAERALRHLKGAVREGSPARERLSGEGMDRKVVTAMLVWACNAFEGGRVYEIQSRINHSCLPNAVVVVDESSSSSSTPGSAQSVRAAAPIAAGDEVCVSYLGLLLYADGPTRRGELRSSKHFACRCERCVGAGRPDAAAAVPCAACHPRRGRQLDEDTQYDDDQAVRYMVPSRVGGEGDKWSWACESCGSIAAAEEEEGGGGGGGDRARDVSHAAAAAASRSVSRSVAAYLRGQLQQQARQHKPRALKGGAAPPASAASSAPRSNGGKDDDESDDGGEGLLEEHLTLASSVAGARHWTTNVLLLLRLDRLLQGYHARLLRSELDGGSAGDNDDDDAMETIASGIDMLERVCRFVDGLGLPVHRGHVLSHAIVGAARALSSLGDAKSRSYAAEWLDRLDGGYVEKFEPDGIQRVVAALRGRAPNPGQPGDERKAKRSKSRK
jgi:hypothetical protein